MSVSQTFMIEEELTLLAFQFVASAVYNICFSPLAKYPGPLFSKISSIPSFYYAFTGYRHVWIWQCHQIYGSSLVCQILCPDSNYTIGDVFRFQPNGLMVNSPTGFQTIYGGKPNVKKGKFYEVFPRSKESRNTLNTVDKTIHAHKRRVLNAAFSDNALRSAETFIIKHIDRWNELFVEDKAPGTWTEPQNLSPSVDLMFFDILGDLCFGRSFETKEKAANPLKDIPHSISVFTKRIYPVCNLLHVLLVRLNMNRSRNRRLSIHGCG
jgi:hypothetical protein